MERTFRPLIESKLGPVEAKDWLNLCSFIRTVYIPRGAKINFGTDFCHYIWLLADGAVKMIQREDEKIIDLFLPGSFFTDVMSLSLHKRTNAVFIPVKDSTLHQLDFSALMKAAETCPFLANVGRLIMEYQMVRETETRRAIGNLFAEEKIRFLYEKTPELFLNFSMKDIAQFIGIKPESMSRLRRKIMN